MSGEFVKLLTLAVILFGAAGLIASEIISNLRVEREKDRESASSDHEASALADTSGGE